MMRAFAVHPRTRRSVIPCAYFVFLGLCSPHSPRCRGISISPKTVVTTSDAYPAASDGSRLRRQLRWIPTASCKSGRIAGRPHITASRRRCAATTTGNECASPIVNEDGSDASAAFKWGFSAAAACGSKPGKIIRNILVCGDGDLSYSAEISDELNRIGIDLYATVLEEEHVHNQVYQYSKVNTDTIAFSGHLTMFGIDATALSTHFADANFDAVDSRVPSLVFDRIQFNFPHWRGKSNNRYNRQLLNDFFQSAARFLSRRGEIHVALCDGQGGCSATSLQEWRGSWTASMFAAEHGLLLARVFPYKPQYRLSAHRGADRPFNLGKSPKMHVFVKPDGVIEAPREIQLCCRHELHVLIQEDIGDSTIDSIDRILEGDVIETIIREKCIPEGVRVEVPARQLLEIHEPHGLSRVAVFLVVYCGERHPVTREMADQWRESAECEVSKFILLRDNRRGRSVSHAFPYPALHPEIKYHTTGKRIEVALRQ